MDDSMDYPDRDGVSESEGPNRVECDLQPGLGPAFHAPMHLKATDEVLCIQ